MRRPLDTHWRKATCEEVGCEAFRNGYVTTVDISTNLGRKQFYFITHSKRRSYSAQRVSVYVFKFVFPPGTICMRDYDHKLPIEREPVYLVHEGDWRGNPRGGSSYIHGRGEDWVDQFANHQISLAETLKRG
jgi:hypothetical protein